ncbi:MAG: hypothetical protein GJ678_14445 [Rhodobacteraceae bacterium]|nr:hypothetical protein [Paracoccaceae bacterium]
MTIFALPRPTIYQAPKGLKFEELKTFVPDAGRRRLLCTPGDFDTRAAFLGTKIEDHWSLEVKESWLENKESIKRGLAHEFGESELGDKIERFIEIDTKPMSVISYHNDFFAQVRAAYVMGHFYPSLVGAGALGERILNHLIIDMRPMFQNTKEYRKVYRKNSFDNWDVPISTLEAWGVLLPEVVKEFKELKKLRHRSIHFNTSTYDTLRDDSISAILHMRKIIDYQFGTWGARPWFIGGTKGSMFVAKDFENHPFVQTYFAPHFPYVGPLFGMRNVEGKGLEVMDVPDYGDGEWTDEEFAQEFNDRNKEQVITKPPKMRWSEEMPPST